MKLYAVDILGEFEFVTSTRRFDGYIEVPEQYSFDDTPFLTVESGEDGYTFTLDQEARDAHTANATRLSLITEMHTKLTTDVYDRMYEVFKTRDPNSASAYLETWKHMKDNPELYVNQELEFDEDIEDYSKGQIIDTIEKAVDYSTYKVDRAYEYGIWRMKVIQQFRKQTNER